MSASYESSVLSDKIFCDGLITHPEKSYRMLVFLSVILKPQQ